MKLIRKYEKGELDPSSLIGFATITEYVVLDVLGDATKEKFCAFYDLVSESLGTINVKYSILHKDYVCTIRRKYKREFWNFARPKNAKTPDYYICLGFDEYQTEIIRAWIIPGNSEVVAKKGIFIRTISEDRFKEYAVDSAIYDKTFQEMDITTKPEFRNTTIPKISEYSYKNKEVDAMYGAEFYS